MNTVNNIMTEKENTELRILVLGKSSYDNNSSINVLLGRKVYNEDQYLNSVDITTGSIGDMTVKVINTSGVMDSNQITEPKDIAKQIKNSVQIEDLDVIFITTSFPMRWTAEEQSMVKFITKLVGQTALRKKGVLIVTNFSSSQKEDQTNLSHSQKFEEYIGHIMHHGEWEDMKNFLQLFNFGQNFICLDTVSGDISKNGEQISILLNCLRCMKETAVKKRETSKPGCRNKCWQCLSMVCCSFSCCNFCKRKEYCKVSE